MCYSILWYKYLEANNLNIPVIIEVRNQSEIRACLDFPWIRRILLDNMNPEVLKEYKNLKELKN